MSNPALAKLQETVSAITQHPPMPGKSTREALIAAAVCLKAQADALRGSLRTAMEAVEARGYFLDGECDAIDAGYDILEAMSAGQYAAEDWLAGKLSSPDAFPVFIHALQKIGTAPGRIASVFGPGLNN
jgi:hypothetical protein